MFLTNYFGKSVYTLSFKKKILIVVIYAVIIALTVVAGLEFRSFIAHPFDVEEGIDMEKVEETAGNVKLNVLVVGVDKTEGLSDVIMVVRYDEEHSKISAMSIPRDTYVNYNGHTRLVNSVYGAGGIEAVSRVATQLTGLAINYYVQFEVGTFGKLIDLLDGVEFDVPQNMNYDDPVQDLHIHLKAGLQTLNGEDAESMVRFRGYPQADLKRVQVQQDLLKALVAQKLNAKYIAKVPSVYAALKDDIKCNMSLTDMLVYGKSMLKLDLQNDIYTCTMPTMFTNVDSHLYQDRVETDKVVEKYFYDDGPIVGNDPYDLDEEADTTND